MIAQRTCFETAPLRRHLEKTTNGTTATQIGADDTTRRVTRIETISSGAIDLGSEPIKVLVMASFH